MLEQNDADNEQIQGGDLLRTVIDENPSIILLKDWEGNFLLANRALATLYNTTPEQMVGKNDGAFNPNREQVEFYLRNVQAIMSQEETQIVMEESTDAVTGEVHYFQSIKKPLRGPDGAPQILVIATDVTDLRRAKNDLEASEKRLNYVLDVTREGIWDWNILTGVVTHNSRWCQIMGLEEGYHSHPISFFASLLYPEDQTRAMELIQQCLQHGMPYQSEHRMVRPDGSVIWVLDRGDVVERDTEGKATRMIGSAIDITERKLAEKRLAERESYLRATLDNFPFMIWLKDEQSRFLTVNRRFAEAAGYADPEMLVGKTDLDLWPRELAELYRADDTDVMVSGQEKSVEEPLETNDCRTWIETYKHPVTSPEGQVIGTVGFARDVTEKHVMRQALERSEQRWQLALEGNNDGIWDWNLEDDTVFYSTRWKAMLGYTDDELPNEIAEWRSRVHPEDWVLVMGEITRHINRETPYYQTEHRLLCKDGSYKWILDRGKAIYSDDGTALRMVGSHTDITERKKAEDIIQDRNEQLDTLFSLSPDGLLTFDICGHVKYANPAFLSLTGLSMPELVGLNEEQFVSLMQSISSSDQSFPSLHELEVVGGSVEERQKLAVANMARTSKMLEITMRIGQAKTTSRIIYLRDVTYEWEVAKMKSEFLSTAAHELRTPMASVYGFTELLLARDYSAQDRTEMLEIILRQSSLVNTIVNELLDLSRIEARRGKDFVYTVVDLVRLLIESAHSLKLGPQHQLVTKLPDQEVRVKVDPGKIRQAFNNIIGNAIKYSPQGGLITIDLQREFRNQRGHGVVTITDQGIGMTTEQAARVGERFYRADTSGNIPGTGLGMAIVKEIIDLHHGEVRVRSQLGMGTTVTITLPEFEGANA